MQRLLLTLIAFLVCDLCFATVDFDSHFEDKTLRLDYTFCGDNHTQQIFVDELLSSDGWYGRRVNLNQLLVQGNGQIIVTDTLSHDTLYIQSFSTLFQEWQSTEEASRVKKSFENVFVVPFPRHPVNITVRLLDTHNKVRCTMTHRVNPKDILIRHIGTKTQPWSYVRKNGDSKEKIDLVFVAEGYTQAESEIFYKDCNMAMEAILSHEPFKSMQDRFNFIGVACPSVESGISVPHSRDWRATAIAGNYDTFYSDRYLTTLKVKNLHNILSGIPYEHIIILANTSRYGGGGIYNSYLMSSSHNRESIPVVVHEFGHSFAGLGDEYYYDDEYEPMYPSDTEPWEPNITTLVDFGSKWKDMLSDKILKEIPTIPDGKDLYTKLGVYEGAGYQSKGVYRPVQECRMKVNYAPEFCPVCQRAIKRMIEYYTTSK